MKRGLIVLLLLAGCQKGMTREEALSLQQACISAGMDPIVRRDNLVHPYDVTSVSCMKGYD